MSNQTNATTRVTLQQRTQRTIVRKMRKRRQLHQALSTHRTRGGVRAEWKIANSR